MASSKPISVESNPKTRVHEQKIRNFSSTLLHMKVIERFSTASKGENNIHWNLIKFYDFLI